MELALSNMFTNGVDEKELFINFGDNTNQGGWYLIILKFKFSDFISEWTS